MKQSAVNRFNLSWRALASLGAAIAFVAFFFAAKHRPWLAPFAPFGEDPYDAVGSFAVQLATVAAMLSALRAWRPYEVHPMADGQVLLILRAAFVAIVSIFAALLCDLVAMVRHGEVWFHTSQGIGLFAFLAISTAASTAGIALLVRCVQDVDSLVPIDGRRRVLVVVAAFAAVLAFYPESWRQGVTGTILTALFGGVLLLVATYLIASALLPPVASDYEDLLDDARAILGRFGLHPKERGDAQASGWPAGALSRWLRDRAWHCAIAIAVFGGLALALNEALHEGLPNESSRALLVLGVFTGIEGLGIFLGYVLFRRMLGLVRRE